MAIAITESTHPTQIKNIHRTLNIKDWIIDNRPGGAKNRTRGNI
jgi:hypothetical protein